MEKLIEALRETLAKLGLDEEAINAALEEAMAKAESEENPAPASDPDVPTEDVVVPPETPSEPAEEGASDVPSADLPPVEDAVPPEAQDVPPEEVVPPADPAPAPAPVDPTDLIKQIGDLTGQLAEYKKANDGLMARVQSLEEALKKAGVIDGSEPTTTVGDELPSSAPQNPTDDVFSDVLREMNGGRRF